MPSRNPFSWRFVAPLYTGSTLNPINSSIIATALVPIDASSIVASIGVLFLTASSPIIWLLIITLIFGITMGTIVCGNQDSAIHTGYH